MAWARPPGAPELPNSPLEALEPSEKEYVPLTENWFEPFLFSLFGASFPLVKNISYRRPFFTGIWKVFALGIGFGYLGFIARDIRRDMAAERDEALRQYIALHPEDFPPYQRKLYKDVIEPWYPFR